MLKRVLDVAAAAAAMMITAPVLAAIATAIKASSPGPIFYRGVRVGRGGNRFRICKFRTMVVNAEAIGGPSTSDDDRRITRIGKFLRKYKLDELPQLFNVMRGDMSLVGPRPEVPEYVGMYSEDEKSILTVRPGITDWASLWNVDEGAVLAGSADPENTYLEQIRPQKIRLQLAYVRNQSFLVDMKILIRTVGIVSGRLLAVLTQPIQQRIENRRSRIPTDAGPIEAPPSEEVSRSLLLQLFRTMHRIRCFEERVGELVAANEVRTPCHLYIGQEAIAAGVCAALSREDTVWGGHRSHGHYLAKGGDLRAMLAEIFGKRAGCSSGRGGSMHLVAPEVGVFGTVPLVAATIPLAVGAGLASRLRRDRRLSVSFFGDGATEEGHFFESLNLAALYRLPVVFVCENNFYASHLHLSERRVTTELHELGRAHGVSSRVVDGNDVVEVYRAAVKAVADAREGRGPTLLECRTFRWRGHVGPAWDMDVGVKRKDELKDWLEKDPLARTRRRLIEAGVEPSALDQIEHDTQVEIEAAVDFARRSPYPGEEALLSHLFAESR